MREGRAIAFWRVLCGLSADERRHARSEGDTIQFLVAGRQFSIGETFFLFQQFIDDRSERYSQMRMLKIQPSPEEDDL